MNMHEIGTAVCRLSRLGYEVLMEYLGCIGPLAGRVLLSLIFLISALGHLGDPQGTMSYMLASNFCCVRFDYVVAMIFLLAGSASLITGFHARAGALLLIIFLIPATCHMHDFWRAEGIQRSIQAAMYFKNLGLMGGLLFVIAHGSGPLSLDQWLENRKRK